MEKPTHTYLTERPDCDICKLRLEEEPERPVEKAYFDAKTIYGSWAYMCRTHMDQVGVGLGLGKGQEIFIKN